MSRTYLIIALSVAAVLIGVSIYHAARHRRIVQQPWRRCRRLAQGQLRSDILREVTNILDRIDGPAMVDDAALLALIRATAEVDLLSDQSLREYLKEINRRCFEIRDLRFRSALLPANAPNRPTLLAQEKELEAWITDQRAEVNNRRFGPQGRARNDGS